MSVTRAVKKAARRKSALKQRIDSTKAFQGDAKIFLDCESMEDFMSKARFRGDWKSGKVRQRIMGKDRWYRICLYLFNTEGHPFHSSNSPSVRITAGDLIRVLNVLLNDVRRAYPEQEVDERSSYAVLSVMNGKP